MHVVTRIAPSPTGDPHVGTAYIALINYVFARQQMGRFIVRIEDTDQARYKPESEAQILSMLEWLGLSPDESPAVGGPVGPYQQSARLGIYKEYAAILLEKGLLYHSFMSQEELAALKSEQIERGNSTIGYDGRERMLSVEEIEHRIGRGDKFSLRLKTPVSGDISFHDYLRGPITINAAGITDAVMIKQDGFPTYHFASVVDDYLMGVSHVIRGEDWIPSTPLHIVLYQAFGWKPPVFVHLPLLRNADKSRLSKRKSDTSVSSYKKKGVLPQALVNYLALLTWGGYGEQEVFSIEQMMDGFRLSDLSLGGPVFDMAKLLHINAQYIRETLSLEFLVELSKPWLHEAGLAWSSEQYLCDVIGAIRPRLTVLSDLPTEASYFLSSEYAYSEEALRAIRAGKSQLIESESRLAQLEEFDEMSVDETLRKQARDSGLKLGRVYQPLRAALTGKGESASVPLIASVLGREEVMSRIGRALGVEGL